MKLAKYMSISIFAAISILATSSYPSAAQDVTESQLPCDIVVNDPMFCDQWHLESISWSKIREFEEFHRYGQGVVVAVIDTGVDWEENDDLTEHNFIEGYDAVNDDDIENIDDSIDKHGHGSHIAAIIAQPTNNSKGAASIAHQAKIMPIRVSENGRDITLDRLAQGIRKAVDKGADILNISVGEIPENSSEESNPQFASALKSAIDYAYSKGRVIVFAVGNGKSYQGYPSLISHILQSEKVITVAALNRSGNIADYSNLQPGIDILAPGGDSPDTNGILQDIYLPFKKEFQDGKLSGTSQSTAMVSAAAALVISELENCQLERWTCVQNPSPRTVREILLKPKKFLSHHAFLDGYAEGDYSSYEEFISSNDIEILFHQPTNLPKLNLHAIEWAAFAHLVVETEAMQEKTSTPQTLGQASSKPSAPSPKNAPPITATSDTSITSNQADQTLQKYWWLTVPPLAVGAPVVFLIQRKKTRKNEK